MATEPVSDVTPPLRPSPIPKSSAEYITLLAHFYRGEKVRMDQWRNRIDVTSNWSFLIVGGLVSIALTTPAAGHGIMLLAMLLVTLVLNIEARRYRFFDAYRSRVRFLERNWHAQVFAPEPDANPDWLRAIGGGFTQSDFPSHLAAGAIASSAPPLRMDILRLASGLAAEDKLERKFHQ
jgi:uncharacterized membrane protein